MQAGEEKSRRLVRTGLARRRWVLRRSVGHVGGALALDVGILIGLFVDTLAWRKHTPTPSGCSTTPSHTQTPRYVIRLVI